MGPDATQMMQAQLLALRHHMEVAAVESERLDAARAEQAREAAAEWDAERERLAAAAADAASRAEAVAEDLVAVRHCVAFRGVHPFARMPCLCRLYVRGGMLLVDSTTPSALSPPLLFACASLAHRVLACHLAPVRINDWTSR